MKKACLFLILTIPVFGKTCDSARFAGGDWKPGATAPRDGTVVEIMETFGIAPWYGPFKWTTETTSTESWMDDGKGHRTRIPPQTFKTSPHWEQVNGGGGVSDDECLFWRPYKKSVSGYVDPTGGAQGGVAYWCAAAHLPYDPKTGYCKK